MNSFTDFLRGSWSSVIHPEFKLLWCFLPKLHRSGTTLRYWSRRQFFDLDVRNVGRSFLWWKFITRTILVLGIDWNFINFDLRYIWWFALYWYFWDLKWRDQSLWLLFSCHKSLGLGKSWSRKFIFLDTNLTILGSVSRVSRFTRMLCHSNLR